MECGLWHTEAESNIPLNRNQRCGIDGNAESHLMQLGAFDRPSSSIFGQLAPTGGIRPSIQQRSRLALTLSEREEISRGLASQQSLRAIAKQLRRAHSTIKGIATLPKILACHPPIQTRNHETERTWPDYHHDINS